MAQGVIQAKRLGWFIGLVTGAVAALTAPDLFAQQPPDCSAPEHRQFDFWLGSWDVTDASDGQKAGENRIERILDGCVLQENWTGAGSSGKSFNIYSRRDGKWHQTWVDNHGSLLQLAGGLVDGKMVLSGVSPDAKGEPILHEISWEQLPEGRVRQHWRASRDQGKTWKDLFDGIYARKQE